MKKNQRGFTIIELIVVIAIIAVLSSIVLTNVMGYIGKAKIARANTDVKNIENALILFYAKYGDYPWSKTGYQNWTEFYSSNQGGEGDPYLTVGGTNYYLSEGQDAIYKSDWVGYNANYFVKNGFYYVYLYDNDGDGKIGYGYIALEDDNWNWYGYKYILCQDCNYCGMYDQPFQLSPY